VAHIAYRETKARFRKKVKFWGVEGGVLPVAVSAVVSAVMLLLAFQRPEWDPVSKTLLSASPFVLTYAYLRAFKTGRRPYFDRDLYFYFINGRGVSPAPPNRQPIHPVLGRKARPGRD